MTLCGRECIEINSHFLKSEQEEAIFLTCDSGNALTQEHRAGGNKTPATISGALTFFCVTVNKDSSSRKNKRIYEVLFITVICTLWQHWLFTAGTRGISNRTSKLIFNSISLSSPAPHQPLHIVICPQAQWICLKILPSIELTVPGTVAMEATLISSFPPPNVVTGLMNSTFHYGIPKQIKDVSPWNKPSPKPAAIVS